MTYGEHMTHTEPGDGSNYRVSCICGWFTDVASRSDRFASETAHAHVVSFNLTDAELFGRL